MHQNRMLSLNCSSLIDVLKYAHYNIYMEENAFVNLLAMETAAPKWRITRSAGAIYLALIISVIGIISLGNMLYQYWQIPRLITQPILYSMTVACAFFLHQRHFICFRYTLTDEMLAIEQIGGNQEKTIAAIQLSAIKEIQTTNKKKQDRIKTVDASLPPKNETTWILTNDQNIETIFIIRATSDFVALLTKARESANEKNTDPIKDA